jgi:hypothetical protein
MKVIKGLVAVLAAFVLTACGSGGCDAGASPLTGESACGGSDGGGTTGEPSVTLVLQDTNGTALATPSLTGTQNAVAVITLLNADGAAVPNTLVSVSGDGLVFTPTTGQTITDSTGTAKVQFRAEDPFASGATTLSAGGSVGGTAVTTSVDIALGAATAQLASITPSATSVPAYQTIQVTVPATLSGSGDPAVQYPVSFSASCGTFDPATATTDSSGIARSAYRNQSSGGVACSGTQTLTASAGSSTVNATVTTVAPTAANIVFVSATPARIYLAGSPGVSQSLLQFKLVDSNNNPVQGENIELTMTLRPTGAYLGSTAGTTTLTQPTDADGTVEVAVNAGSEPGPVQVQATLVSNTGIKNVSNALAIASGLPVQRAFSLSVSTFNIEALNEDGVTTDLTLRIADRLSNPVPDGTTVNFVAEGGQVVASCNTSGASSNTTSGCTVKLASQNPRPSNGRVTVLAWAQGEENFTDTGTPTNNVYDSGEPFDDLGQPFLDKDEDGIYDVGGDVTVGTASGAQACPAGSQSVPGTCDAAWGRALVRASAVITFSGNAPFLANTSGPTATGGNRCVYGFTVRDVNGNPMPAGTTLAVSGTKGGGALTGATRADAVFAGFGGEGDKVPNTSQAGGTIHSAVFTDCVDPASLTFQLKFTTPKSKVTSFFLP